MSGCPDCGHDPEETGEETPAVYPIGWCVGSWLLAALVTGAAFGKADAGVALVCALAGGLVGFIHGKRVMRRRALGRKP